MGTSPSRRRHAKREWPLARSPSDQGVYKHPFCSSLAPIPFFVHSPLTHPTTSTSQFYPSGDSYTWLVRAPLDGVSWTGRTAENVFVYAEHKDPSRVAAGLKASLHNPHVSDEAKRSAQERLKSMGSVQHGKAQHETLGTHHVGASHHQVEDNRVLGTLAALGHLRFG